MVDSKSTDKRKNKSNQNLSTVEEDIQKILRLFLNAVTYEEIWFYRHDTSRTEILKHVIESTKIV